MLRDASNTVACSESAASLRERGLVCGERTEVGDAVPSEDEGLLASLQGTTASAHSLIEARSTHTRLVEAREYCTRKALGAML